MTGPTLLAPLTPAVVQETGHGWSMENGILDSPDGDWKTLPLPGTFSETSYRLRVRLHLPAANDVFHVILPVGNRMTGFELDGWTGFYTGLNGVHCKSGQNLPGAVAGRQVTDSEPHDLELTVRLDSANAQIAATLDARPLYEWTGPIDALSQASQWATTPRGSLALGTYRTHWVVSEVKVKRLESAAPATSKPVR